MDELAVRKTVLMYPTDVRIIERIAEKYGLNDFSTAVRFIVRAWEGGDAKLSKPCDERQSAVPTAGD